MFACGIHDVLGPYADAVFHIENSAIDRDSIQKRGGEVGIVKKSTPFIESQLRGYDGGFMLVSASHKIEKQTCLFILGGNVAYLVNQKYVVG
ncbi:unnamed protein product [marine sediment metagenome]|uniref:Uncharacterized protein n=1 Tax=marine sediment metagenome TaxID=412755 RepID=X1I6K0_9ZZZZ